MIIASAAFYGILPRAFDFVGLTAVATFIYQLQATGAQHNSGFRTPTGLSPGCVCCDYLTRMLVAEQLGGSAGVDGHTVHAYLNQLLCLLFPACACRQLGVCLCMVCWCSAWSSCPLVLSTLLKWQSTLHWWVCGTLF